MPLQGHFANKDDWCTPAAVDALEKTMKEPELNAKMSAAGLGVGDERLKNGPQMPDKAVSQDDIDKLLADLF